MNTSEDDYTRPTIFLIGSLILAVLIMTTCALLLRKPPTADPFDAAVAPGAEAPAASNP